MCAKSVSTPEPFYDINGASFGSFALVVPEFRAGGWTYASHLLEDSLELSPSMDIRNDDEKEAINNGSVKQTCAMNWAIGDMYSSRPPPPPQ